MTVRKRLLVLLGLGGAGGLATCVTNLTSTIQAAPGAVTNLQAAALWLQGKAEPMLTGSTIGGAAMVLGFGGAAFLLMQPFLARRFPRLAGWRPDAEPGTKPRRSSRETAPTLAGPAPLGIEPFGGMPVAMPPAETKEDIGELRAQIEAVSNEMRRRAEELEAKLADLEGPIARGQSGFNSVRAVLALRLLRSSERRLTQLVRAVHERLDQHPNDPESLATKVSEFDTNFDELTRSLVDANIHDAGRVRAELREMGRERSEARAYARTTGIRFSVSQEREALSAQARRLHAFIAEAKGRYLKHCREPLDRWVEEP
jgi:vacuolar-type H+-ATPase subunit E/Vma4